MWIFIEGGSVIGPYLFHDRDISGFRERFNSDELGITHNTYRGAKLFGFDRVLLSIHSTGLKDSYASYKFYMEVCSICLG